MPVTQPQEVLDFLESEPHHKKKKYDKCVYNGCVTLTKFLVKYEFH